MKRYRVHGCTEIEVTVIVEVEDGVELSEEEIYAKAEEEFAGIESFAGFGDCDHLIGVSDEEATIAADNEVIFNDYEEEEE